jgi:D-alanyl-D-alanine carboxypeptidase
MQKPIAVDTLIRQFGTKKLDFEPGSRYSYSNTGFVMLGQVVSKVSGEPFEHFLTRRILRPLGMTNTAFEPETTSTGGYARGYVTFALGPPEIATPEGRGWVAAAGALYSTPTDLAKWDLALMDGKVLKPDSFKLMTTPRKLTDGSVSNYGCGLGIAKRGHQTVYSHSGAVAGFYALNTMFSATRSAVILLSNLDAYDSVNGVYRQITNALVPPPPSDAAVTTTAAKKPPAAPTGIPGIAGPAAPEAARLLFLELQSGLVNRAGLGDEFNYYLTDDKIRGASSRLAPYGQPTKVEVEAIAERGGMEVARTRLLFAKGELKGLMYRTPDGKVQQFFVLKD